eukprot:TRINITY_DN7533_c0_g1_i1.p1 TRINITY_DN7533_c0_g1~~TRINITY_DN7533_c0_g1_i1.p1  ORF type:complete len:570 (-),score=131.72 TRINITY_DN7533_c0_g1_i1:181-1890(-)
MEFYENFETNYSNYIEKIEEAESIKFFDHCSQEIYNLFNKVDFNIDKNETDQQREQILNQFKEILKIKRMNDKKITQIIQYLKCFQIYDVNIDLFKCLYIVFADLIEEIGKSFVFGNPFILDKKMKICEYIFFSVESSIVLSSRSMEYSPNLRTLCKGIHDFQKFLFILIRPYIKHMTKLQCSSLMNENFDNFYKFFENFQVDIQSVPENLRSVFSLQELAFKEIYEMCSLSMKENEEKFVEFCLNLIATDISKIKNETRIYINNSLIILSLFLDRFDNIQLKKLFEKYNYTYDDVNEYFLNILKEKQNFDKVLKLLEIEEKKISNYLIKHEFFNAKDILNVLVELKPTKQRIDLYWDFIKEPHYLNEFLYLFIFKYAQTKETKYLIRCKDYFSKMKLHSISCQYWTIDNVLSSLKNHNIINMCIGTSNQLKYEDFNVRPVIDLDQLPVFMRKEFIQNETELENIQNLPNKSICQVIKKFDARLSCIELKIKNKLLKVNLEQYNLLNKSLKHPLNVFERTSFPKIFYSCFNVETKCFDSNLFDLMMSEHHFEELDISGVLDNFNCNLSP